MKPLINEAQMNLIWAQKQQEKLFELGIESSVRINDTGVTLSYTDGSDKMHMIFFPSTREDVKEIDELNAFIEGKRKSREALMDS